MPGLLEMQECVVRKNLRPEIKEAWKQHSVSIKMFFGKFNQNYSYKVIAFLFK